MASLPTDLRLALRSFAKSPVFTLIALVTLALGIGANAAIFSVVKNVLLEPLPHPEPERLVKVFETNLERGVPEFSSSALTFREYHLERIAALLAKIYPISNKGWRIRVEPLKEYMVEGVEPALLILTLAVGLVLLIACANVANLMLSRTARRRRELALRAALGASRDQLIRQILTESLLLALGGGALGIVLAWCGVPLLIELYAGDVPRASSVAVDGGVLLMSLVLTAISGVVFGLFPALRASRPAVQSALQEGSPSASGNGGGAHLRSRLVIGEVAVALMLLAGAGLLIRSFALLVEVHPGFDPEGALTVQLQLPEARYPDKEAQTNFYRQLFERLEALPGVERAGAIFPMPLSGSSWMMQVFVEGRPLPALSEHLRTELRMASPGYFEAMGIPLRAGRTFAPSDDSESKKVVVISESAARLFWPGEDPVGQRITFWNPHRGEIDDEKWGTIIGVVGDVLHESLAGAGEPEMYLSYLQTGADSPTLLVTLVLRTAVDPESLAGPVRELLAELDDELPLFNVRSLETLLADSLDESRSNSLLLGIFATLAVLLAVIGVFGIVSYVVTEQMRELGVRLALGAERRSIFGLVLRRGMAPVGLGVVLGLVGALAGTRILGGLIHEISPTDPLTFGAVVIFLAAMAVVACLAPAWRATRIDPIAVLRKE